MCCELTMLILNSITFSHTKSFLCNLASLTEFSAQHIQACVKYGEKTAHEECMERGIMSPSDYETKPGTVEKSRHVMLEESWERINTKLDFS